MQEDSKRIIDLYSADKKTLQGKMNSSIGEVEPFSIHRSCKLTAESALSAHNFVQSLDTPRLTWQFACMFQPQHSSLSCPFWSIKLAWDIGFGHRIFSNARASLQLL